MTADEVTFLVENWFCCVFVATVKRNACIVFGHLQLATVENVGLKLLR